MDAERIAFSIFYLSFMAGLFITQVQASYRRNELYDKYGIRRQGLFAIRKLNNAMTPEEKAALKPYERRADRFLLWGLLIIFVVTATYGLTKAALYEM